MAILKILYYPDTRLRKIARPVKKVDAKIKQIVNNMFETMYEAQGIGLAATQVNIHQQIIVLDLSPKQTEPLCLINPIIETSSGLKEEEEGCLSVPEYYAKIERAENICIKALDQSGEMQRFEADELLAICIQHEMDHLKGRLFVDYLSPLKQQRLKKKMAKFQKQNA